MKRHKETITFWIQVVSFFGSVLFLFYALFMEKPQSKQEKDCIEKMLYYQHKADSLQHVIDTLQTP